MKILVIGAGGREHALSWRLRKSNGITELHAAPGNPGIAEIGICHITADYVALAQEIDPDLTVVGPEAPLVAGIVDQFRSRGMPIVGPTSSQARLEGSKVYAKRFMERLGIPTARFRAVSDSSEALRELANFSFPVVLKTDGLAAGKGVLIVNGLAEARAALELLAFPIVIEEFLEGEEVSFIVLSDGKRVLPLEPSQDHKRIFDNDQGPNTGGMGAYSEGRILNDEQRGDILDRIIGPVVSSTGYTGFLYAGLIMTAAGPKVLEFNVRLGDPETQALMLRMQSDFAEILQDAARGRLQTHRLDWSPEPATCVVIASAGYPELPRTGARITGIDQVTDAVVFQAGTRREGADLVTAGGRVLGVAAGGPDLKTSMARAYQGVGKIDFEGMQYRKDVGLKGLRRYNEVGLGT